MLRIDQSGFHSPIVRSRRYASIDEENSKLSMTSEPREMFDQLESERGTISASISGPNNKCYDHRSHNHYSNVHSNLQCVSFDESIADNAIIDDVISVCDDSDIELMQEALSVLFGDGEEEVASICDRCDLHDKPTTMKDRFTKQCSELSVCSVRPIQQNHRSCREVNHPMTAGHDNNMNCDFGSETLDDLHPLLLPQVTFDEEEVFDRRNFFEQEETLCHPSENECSIPIVSPKPTLEPSSWLLEKLTLGNMPSKQSGVSRGSTRKVNARRTNKTVTHASVETKHKHWSEEEDETLKLAVETEQIRPIDWIKIARNYFNNMRSATQCKNRWKNYLKPGVVRGNWKKHEDEFIVSMVSRGFKWVDIAKGLPGRTGEHVRERYVNVLDDKLKKTCWTPEEDRILFEHQRILGNKWSEIRKLLPGRSDNSIKNRYHNRRNAHLRRLKRESAEKKGYPSLPS